jgi:hypothetical protein
MSLSMRTRLIVLGVIVPFVLETCVLGLEYRYETLLHTHFEVAGLVVSLISGSFFFIVAWPDPKQTVKAAALYFPLMLVALFAYQLVLGSLLIGFEGL